MFAYTRRDSMTGLLTVQWFLAISVCSRTYIGSCFCDCGVFLCLLAYRPMYIHGPVIRVYEIN